MKRLLVILCMVFPVTSLTCAPSTAMAAPRRAPLFVPGSSPSRPMEVLGGLVVEMGSTAGKGAALEALRERAMQAGADAVLHVVVTTGEREVNASQITGLPMALMGSLIGLATGKPGMLKEAVDAAGAHVFKRPVVIVRGVAVKYVR